MAEEDAKDYKPAPAGKFFVAGWIGAVVVALVLTGGLVLAREFWIGRQTSELEQQLAKGRRVLVARATAGPRVRAISLPANIHGYVETQIFGKVAGYLKQINVDKGDRVKQGQVLAVIESPETDHQVMADRATYEIDRLTNERNQQLLAQGVIAQQTADESRAAMDNARATLEAELALQSYETIKAPFSGMITARYVDPGALIPQSTTSTTAQTPVVSMATLDTLRIYVEMPQNFATQIKDGDTAAISVVEYPQRVFKGSITRHPEALNIDTRTMRVEVDLHNPDSALLPGMYATAKFTVSAAVGVPMVSDDALVFRDGKVYVPVVRDDKLHLAEVSLGYDNGQNVEIISGLRDDDMVALNVGQAARDGEPVQPVLQDEQKAQR
ncbi:MAG TPA: efflux RND transporter periplasmic adaptor subunit [Candidatus Binataceae bacterium]|nr:efflux RND transporter periplasmic adaptor subunit [Candidatus Binataceae bacterium]